MLLCACCLLSAAASFFPNPESLLFFTQTLKHSDTQALLYITSSSLITGHWSLLRSSCCRLHSPASLPIRSATGNRCRILPTGHLLSNTISSPVIASLQIDGMPLTGASRVSAQESSPRGRSPSFTRESSRRGTTVTAQCGPLRLAKAITFVSAPAPGRKREILPPAEQPGEAPPGRQRPPDQKHLDAAILHGCQQIADERLSIVLKPGLNGIQHPAAMDEIHGAPVIGVHEAEIPELRPLIEIGHARRGHLDQQLGQRVEHAEAGDAPLESRINSARNRLSSPGARIASRNRRQAPS